MSPVGLARPDITLHVDDHGVIREASLSGTISNEGVEAWVGRPWFETVAGAGGDNVTHMLEDARTSGVAGLRHLVQRFPSGRELPIEYTTIRDPGRRGGLLVFGKNLQVVAELQSRLAAAQQATEREYWKLRDVETRYRMLFDTSTEAVLMVGGEDLRVVEANPAAVRALGMAPGWEFAASLSPAEREGFASMLQRVREHGRTPGIVLHLGAGLSPWAVRASLMVAESGLRYLLHVAPAGVGVQVTAQPSPSEHLPVAELIEQLPDGFVVVSADGLVLDANQAFLDQVQAGALGSVQGEKLGRWLSQPGADASVLLDNVRRHDSVRLFESTLSGELGTETPVEISAVSEGTAAGEGVVGVLLRDVSRRASVPGIDASGGEVPELPELIDILSGQLGQMPLPEMVRMATDTVERRLIKEALERVGGNRTAAAKLLGLSRQSLHTKLNHFAAVNEGGDTRTAAE